MLSNEILVVVIIGTTGTVLLIVTIVLFLIRYNNKILKLRIAKQRELIEAEIHGKEVEQTRIARGIHDAIGGNLTALNLSLQRIAKEYGNIPELTGEITMLRGILDDTHKSVRQVSRDLLAHDVEVYGLLYSVNEMLKHSGITNISVESVEDRQDVHLDIEQKVAIYRVIQEILNNALRHSQTTDFKVLFDFDDQGSRLEIKFNGSTFDYVASKSNSEGLGLKNIESRVQFLGGGLKYSSSNNRNFYEISIAGNETN